MSFMPIFFLSGAEPGAPSVRPDLLPGIRLTQSEMGGRKQASRSMAGVTLLGRKRTTATLTFFGMGRTWIETNGEQRGNATACKT